VFDSLYMLFYRLQRATTLRHALKQLLPPSLVTSACRHLDASACLLSYLAKTESLDKQVLLDEVAMLLNIESAKFLSVPSVELIEQTGYDAQHLRQLAVLPQSKGLGSVEYVLVVSEPEDVDLEEYALRGIEVRLGIRDDIEETWKRFFLLMQGVNGQGAAAQRLSNGQLFAILAKLASDAQELGASEVFIGHPTTTKYEFFASSQCFEGNIHPSVYESLVAQFIERGQIRSFEQAVESKTISSLNVSLTRNFDSAVVFLSWSDKIQSEPGELSQVMPEPDQVQKPKGDSIYLGEIEVESELDLENIGKRVLLVDDDKRFSSILGRILERSGFIVTSAASAQDALELMSKAQQLPDVIISDVHMPNMDGVTFLRQLRRQFNNLPVVMLTSDEDEILEIELVELGADAFVRKCDDVRVLVAWCSNLSSRKPGRQLVNA